MGEPLAGEIDEMLESVQEEVDDADLAFKLRTARQLLVVYDERLRKYREALDEADLEEETLENLRQLGYLD